MTWHGFVSCLGVLGTLGLIAFIAWATQQPWFNSPTPTGWWAGLGDTSVGADSGAGPAPMPKMKWPPAPAPTGRVGFAVIKRTDPEFDIDGFYRRVDEMFDDLQKTAIMRDLAPAAHYIQGVAFKELQARVSALAPQTAAPRLAVVRTRATVVEREGDEDRIRVMVTAASDTAGSDPITGTPLTEGGEARWYAQEYWTLVRNVGARTLPDASIHRCPNCGGPITAATRAECGYCGTRLCDPARDWVVSEIEGG